MSETILPPFAALRAFDQVGRTGGIRKAAAALGVSHTIVSRHVAALEALLGTALLNRRTGALTPAGAAYHARIARAIGDIAAATADARGRPDRALVIWCSPGFSLHWLTRRLPDFARIAGQTVIDLRATDNEPDFDHHDADGDIRYLADAARIAVPRGVRAEAIIRPPVFPVAAPDFLSRLSAPPATIADIARLDRIEEESATEWAQWFAAQGLMPAHVTGRVVRFGQAHLALAAARAGQGVALSNPFLVGEDLAAGRLVRLEPTRETLTPIALGTYYFRAPRSRWGDPGVARFRRWLQQAVMHDGPA